MKKKLLVLFGGESSEHEVSCVSAANVCENADKNIFDIILMGITKDGKWWLYDGGTEHMRSHSWQEDTANLRPAVISPCKAHHGILVFDKPRSSFEVVHIDIVFPVLHGRNGEDGRMRVPRFRKAGKRGQLRGHNQSAQRKRASDRNKACF